MIISVLYFVMTHINTRKVQCEIMIKVVFFCLFIFGTVAAYSENDVKSVKVEIRNMEGRQTLYVNDAPMPFVGYRDHHNVKHIDTLTNFADSGIKIFFASCNKKIYKNPDNQFEKNIQKVLSVVPDAYFIVLLSMDLDSTFDPQWIKNNPDELCLWPKEAFKKKIDGGDKYLIGSRASMASKKWKKEVEADLTSLVEYIGKSPFSDRIIGYFLSGGSGEWSDFLDYSKPAKKAFKDWLRTKYSGNISLLNKAWSCKFNDFEEADIPEWNDFNKADVGIFWDPAKSMRMMDFLYYHHGLIADVQIDFARLIKRRTDNKSLVGLWNGYLFMPEWWQDDSPHGILPMRRVKMFSKLLASPYIDFITAPYDYMERHCGGTYYNAPLQDSIILNGKMLLVEDDSRTHSTPMANKPFEKIGNNFGQAADVWETENIFKRNFAASLTKPGTGYYYFGLGNEGNKWFDAKTIKFLGKLNNVGKNLLLNNKSKSEVAMIVSFESFMYQKFNNLGRDVILRQTLYNMTRLGAPFDVFLDSDLLNPNFPKDKYKMYIFLNSYYMPREMRSAIKNKVCRNDSTAVWIYACGLIDENTLSPANMTDITGFENIEMLNMPLSRVWCVLTDYNHFVVKGLSENIRYGSERALFPIFWSEDKNCQVLGEILSTTDENGILTFRKPGLYYKKFKDWTSIWSVAPNMPSALLRSIAKNAGVHIYSENDDQIFASEKLIGINALHAGKHTLKLPAKCNIYDAVEDKCLAENADSISFDLKLGENKLLITK